jgi:hypothetical protein
VLFGTAALFNFAVAGGLLFLRPQLTPLLALEPASGSNLLLLYMTIAFIALFGYAYACVARDRVRYRPYIALGAIGKLMMVAVTALTWLSGAIGAQLPSLAAGDLLFAALFIQYLRRTRAAQ